MQISKMMRQPAKTHFIFLVVFLAAVSILSEVSSSSIPKRLSRRSTSLWLNRRFFYNPSTNAGDCRDKRNDCVNVIDPKWFVEDCDRYRGECDYTCGICQGYVQCDDEFPTSRCVTVERRLQCRSRENMGRCKKTCCDCKDDHPNCM